MSTSRGGQYSLVILKHSLQDIYKCGILLFVPSKKNNCYLLVTYVPGTLHMQSPVFTAALTAGS